MTSVGVALRISFEKHISLYHHAHAIGATRQFLLRELAESRFAMLLVIQSAVDKRLDELALGHLHVGAGLFLRDIVGKLCIHLAELYAAVERAGLGKLWLIPCRLQRWKNVGGGKARAELLRVVVQM